MIRSFIIWCLTMRHDDLYYSFDKHSTGELIRILFNIEK